MSEENVSTDLLILFDIDGTLLQVGDPYHAVAMLEAIREVYGVEPNASGIPMGGMLDAQIARLILERQAVDPVVVEERLPDLMARMGTLYAEAAKGLDFRQRLLPGVPEAVGHLHRHGWTGGVLTGNAQLVAKTKLESSGLGGLFEIGAFGDTAVYRGQLVALAHQRWELVRRTPIPPSRTVLVGDTPRDIEAARQAETRVVAVATGRHDRESLAGHGPDALLEDLSDPTAFADAVLQALSVPASRD
jgi:phosphoglycolate phosphatase-like HAD superfamily hydrolase